MQGEGKVKRWGSRCINRRERTNGIRERQDKKMERAMGIENNIHP
jgi:hypothetical protein